MGHANAFKGVGPAIDDFFVVDLTIDGLMVTEDVSCSNLLFSACRFIYFPFVVLRVHICSPPLVILTGRDLTSQNYIVAESYRDRKEVFIQYIAKGKNESARASTCLTQRSDRTRRTNPRKDATEIHPSRTHQHCYSGPSKYFREGRQLPYARC
jgi:hypothetical protein